MASIDDTTEFLPNPPLLSLSPPIPLQLCGFQTGDSVQVRGDTGELQFSVHFSLRRPNDHFNLLEAASASAPETANFQSPPSSPYLNPTGDFQNRDINSADENSRSSETSSRGGGGVTTRLRSGALSPIKYYLRRICGRSSEKKRRSKCKGNKGEGGNVLDEILRRRSLPRRPCNSYTFFVMKNWGIVRRSSFVETSKELSEQWSDLAHDVKKEYEDMAFKDNERYKKQCLMLTTSSKY